MRDAQKSLLEPTPGRTQQDTRHFSMSQPTESPSASDRKTRRAKTCEGKPEVPKAARTYGSQERRRIHNTNNIFEFQDSVDADSGSTNNLRKRVTSMKGNAGEKDSTTSFPGTTTTRGSSLDRDTPAATNQSQNKEPAEQGQSATIPTIEDSTPLQQPDPATTPAGFAFASDARFNPAYSDGRMPTPTISSHSHSAESLSFVDGQSNPHAVMDSTVDGKTRKEKANEENQRQEPSSSASVISPSRTIAVKQATSEDFGATEQDASMDDELQMSLPTFQTAGSTRPMVILPDQCPAVQWTDPKLTAGQHADDEESMGPPKARKRKRNDHDANGEPGSDDLAIGIPKEQYQPRPSRSRGNPNNDEIVVPADYSKRPEALAKPKKRSRRYHTTAFVELIPKPEAEEDEADEEKSIPDLPELQIPEFTKKETEKVAATEATQSGTLDILLEKEPPDKESSPKKQRGRPKKMPEKDTLEHPVKSTVDADTNTAKESPVKASDSGKPSKRGRPSKKSLPVVEEDSNSEDDGEQESHRVVDPSAKKCTEALKETTGNVAQTDNNVDISPEKSSSMSTTGPPATPQKAAANPSKGPDKHSPISSGKVSYRVGLSKRARIEPLLRMVRK